MFKEQLQNGKVNGILVKVASFPAIVIMAQQCGFDFIFYDCEHGILDEEKLHDLMVLGNCNGFPSIVRVPQLSKKDVSRMLDYGATGIMVPMVETKEQAIQLVEWSKYPPIGKRSYSGGANTHYAPGGNHAKNMREMNEKVISIVQIESIRGVENIDEILSVEGIDAAIVGPCDLGISMDNPDNVMDPKELEYIQCVADACKKYHKGFGIIGGMELLKYFKDDLSIFVGTIDLNLIRSGLIQNIEQYKQL